MTSKATTNARTANKPAAPAPAPTADQAQQEAATASSTTQEPNNELDPAAQSIQAAALDNTAAPAGTTQPKVEQPPAHIAQQDEVRDYLVTSVPIRHNGKFYDVCAVIALSSQDADRLGGLVHLFNPEDKE